MVSLSSSAQEKLPPMAMSSAVRSVPRFTTTGFGALADCPGPSSSPTCPEPRRPQQLTEPSWESTQVWLNPASTLTAGDENVIGSPAPPGPHWPNVVPSSLHRHETVPSSMRKQLCAFPEDTPIAVVPWVSPRSTGNHVVPDFTVGQSHPRGSSVTDIGRRHRRTPHSQRSSKHRPTYPAQAGLGPRRPATGLPRRS